MAEGKWMKICWKRQISSGTSSLCLLWIVMIWWFWRLLPFATMRYVVLGWIWNKTIIQIFVVHFLTVFIHCTLWVAFYIIVWRLVLFQRSMLWSVMMIPLLDLIQWWLKLRKSQTAEAFIWGTWITSTGHCERENGLSHTRWSGEPFCIFHLSWKCYKQSFFMLYRLIIPPLLWLKIL